MKLNRASCAALCAVVSSCTILPGTSNQPDSGIVCDAGSSPLGSGAMSGDLALTVGSSYENRNTIISGTDAGGGTPSGGWISIALYEQTLTCGATHTQAAGDFVGIYLFDHAGQFDPGTYRVNPGDGGQSCLLYRGIVDDAGTRVLVAKSGDVTVTSVQPCALAGSFDVQIDLRDGGSSALTGSFTSAYCR